MFFGGSSRPGKAPRSRGWQTEPLQILGQIMRLRRACCHPKLVIPETDLAGSKLMQALEKIDELRQGNHRALIFSQFVDHLKLVREQLEERKISYQQVDG